MIIGIIIGFGVLLIMWCLCLVGPLVLVSRWRSRPVTALFSGAILCGLTFAGFVALLALAANTRADMSLLTAAGIALFAFVPALPVLAIVQAVKLRKKRKLTPKEIADTF